MIQPESMERCEVRRRRGGQLKLMENFIPEPNSGCWLWLGHCKFGYGRFKGGMAHRGVYERLVGPVPDGLQLDHLCRVKSCVNPRHLEPVTARTNTLRGIGPTAANAVKTHCPKGHEYTPENTYEPSRGRRWRRCRACQRAHHRDWWAANGKEWRRVSGHP